MSVIRSNSRAAGSFIRRGGNQASGGNPSLRYSELDQRWTFVVPAGSAKELHVKGYKSNLGDGDDFRFEYSTDGVNFTVVTLNLPLVDDNVDRIAAPPAGLTGTVTIRVVDTNHTPGSQALDTVSIDEIWIPGDPLVRASDWWATRP